jgi:UDP-N-acetylmuramoyl-tripeptide--D-alanyl-D-alanine ligase
VPSLIYRWAEAAKPVIGKKRHARLRKWLASRVRRTNGAKFIAITGSSAKSTTTALLSHILRGNFVVHEQVGVNHLRPIRNSIAGLEGRKDYVVVEAAAYQVGQMKRMAALLQPDVAIVTLVGLEHKSAFGSAESLAAEKSELVAGVRRDGLVLLNADDPLVMGMAARTSARVVTYGRTAHAHYRAVDVASAFPERLSMTVVWSGGSLAVETNFIGDHFWLPTIAAVAAGIELGVPPADIAERIRTLEPLTERCGIVSVPGGPHFILDTMKAPGHSLQLAVEIVAKAKAPRKRIILGHISDYGGSNNKQYGDFYRMARGIADQVIFVGNHSHRSRATRQELDENRFRAFATTQQAAAYIQETAIAGEVVLLKGSVDLHLERIALSQITDVRCWVVSCGKLAGCRSCGQYRVPYEAHPDAGKYERLRRKDG